MTGTKSIIRCQWLHPPALPCPAGVAGEAMRTATYWIVLATVLVNGGACPLLLDRLGLRAGSAGDAAAGCAGASTAAALPCGRLVSARLILHG